MELRIYLAVLLRRWYIVLALPLLVIIFAIYQDVTRTTNYTATARLSVVRQPETDIPEDFQFDEYYNYLASEFEIDDLVEIVRGNVFANNVAIRIAASGETASGGEVQGAIVADRKHRILTISATSSDPEQALRIANAAATEVLENTSSYLGHEQSEPVSTVRAVQLPGGVSSDTQRTRLILILSILVAFGFGVLLAFAIDYLDDRIYDAESACHVIELPNLAVIPGDES